jgi:hypothetical protein
MGSAAHKENRMTCTRLNGRGFNGIICTTPDFKPGDPAPEGYLAWHEWAEVQHKAGLRQKECGRCGKWKYPQELSDQLDWHEVKSRNGPVTVQTPVCLHCVMPNSEHEAFRAENPAP